MNALITDSLVTAWEEILTDEDRWKFVEDTLLASHRELELAPHVEAEAIRHTVISTIGGVDYEGFPTSRLNYLQRLRILVAKEKRLEAEWPECSGDSACCPENAGYGCCQSQSNRDSGTKTLP